MATLDDVAKEAHVSPITVSRVMNGSTAVRPETKERVLIAVKKLNYQPNLLARSLSANKMNSIGVIVTRVENPMYPLMISGIYKEAAVFGYDVILSCSHDLESAIKSVTTLMNKRVSGLIVLPIEFPLSKMKSPHNSQTSASDIGMMHEFATSFYDTVKQYKFDNYPVVVIGKQIENGVSGRVIENYYGGACMAVDYLVEKGHEKIGFVANYCKTEGIWGERYKGFFDTMEKHHLPVEKKWITYCDETIDSAKSAMSQILANISHPTAVYCANDTIAVGAINAVHDAGLSVPEDISVIGHDGNSFGEVVRPSLTTVAIYPDEIGKHAVRIFMDVINEEPGTDHVILPRIIERQSVKKCCKLSKR